LFEGETMKIPTFALAALMLPATRVALSQNQETPRDTVYQLSPVIITATQARERETPATFSNLTPREIRERYSFQDVPVLLSELPSITTYSENGNGIGYNYINLRGFDQRRLSVMINVSIGSTFRIFSQAWTTCRYSAAREARFMARLPSADRSTFSQILLAVNRG
jgi:outer membrane receptor for ferrienterochelin and colicin